MHCMIMEAKPGNGGLIKAAQSSHEGEYEKAILINVAQFDRGC